MNFILGENKLSVNYELMTEKSFGKRLQTWLDESNVKNQAELARLVGVSPTYISNLLRDFSPSRTGKPQPSREIVDRLARVLSVPLAEAREAAGYNLPRKDESGDDRRNELLYIYDELNESRKQDILLIARLFLNTEIPEDPVEKIEKLRSAGNDATLDEQGRVVVRFNKERDKNKIIREGD